MWNICYCYFILDKLQNVKYFPHYRLVLVFFSEILNFIIEIYWKLSDALSYDEVDGTLWHFPTIYFIICCRTMEVIVIITSFINVREVYWIKCKHIDFLKCFKQTWRSRHEETLHAHFISTKHCWLKFVYNVAL